MNVAEVRCTLLRREREDPATTPRRITAAGIVVVRQIDDAMLATVAGLKTAHAPIALRDTFAKEWRNQVRWLPL